MSKELEKSIQRHKNAKQKIFDNNEIEIYVFTTVMGGPAAISTEEPQQHWIWGFIFENLYIFYFLA